MNRIRIKSTDFLYLLLLIVVNVYKYMAKVVILQGSAVTQIVLGGHNRPWAPQYILRLQISYSVYVYQKLWKSAWQ